MCNLNSLVNKLNLVSDLLHTNNVDILAVTESWLLPSIPDSFLSINGYHPIARTDTTSNFRKHGVCFYIKDSLSFISLESNCSNVHAIHLVSLNCYLAVVYRPPSNSVLDDQALLTFLDQFCPCKEALILGDFNLPNIDWSKDDALFCDYDPLTLSFTTCFNNHGLLQWVDFPTFVPSGNTLDLVLSSEHDRIGNIRSLCPLPGCGHVPIVFDYFYSFGPVDLSCDISGKRAWSRGKYKYIEEYVSLVDWDYEFLHLSVTAMMCKFLAVIRPLIDSYIPLCQYMRKTTSPVSPPNTLKRKRQQAWKLVKSVRAFYGRHSVEFSCALTHYNSINHQFKTYFIRSQIDHEKSLMDNIKSNPKAFHQYIRSKKVGAPAVGPLKRADGSLVENCGSMAEIFVNSFASVFKVGNPNPLPHQVFHGSTQEIVLSHSDVSRRLAELDVCTSMGPDGLHPMLLKSCPSLSYPIYKIFKCSLNEGRLPDEWKISEVVPIFKKGSRSAALNYRPISLTSVCCKTMERIVADHLYAYLENNSLLSREQYGFRRGRTVDEQLILTYDFVTRGLDQHNIVDVILFDFAKAFDVVNHHILIQKLRCIGVGGILLDWISSFLQDRTMYVSVSGCRSSSHSVTSGVPQGSVLGPLLFLVYVNHLPSYIVNNCMIFADDLKIYLPYCSSSPLTLALGVSSCQHDIDNVSLVAESWGLSLNKEKCALLRFHRGSVDWQHIGTLSSYYLHNHCIAAVASARDLGVLVDSTLRFHLHIRATVNRASGLAANLLRSTLCRSQPFMITMYKTHIRPLLEYASCVWNTGFQGDLRLLESVQRSWTRHVDGVSDLPYSERLRILDLYSVQGRLLRADLIKYWKIFNNVSSICPTDIFTLAPILGTRGHRFKIFHTHSSLEARSRSFSNRHVSLWNSLPDPVVASKSINAFKSALHSFLGPRLYHFPD